MFNLQKSLRSLKNLPKPSTLSGSLGLSPTVVNVPTRLGFSYVRLLGNTSEVIQAYNPTVSATFDVPVTVQWDGTKYVVLGRDVNRYTSWSSSPYLPQHAYSHGLRGGDTIWIPSEQFTPLLVYPSGTSLQIAPYTYNWQGAWKQGGGTGTSTITLPSDSSKQSVMLLYINWTTSNPAWLAGTEAPAALTARNDLIPYLPTFQTSTGIPLAMVRIPSGTTSLTWDNLYDIRQYFQGTYSGSSGGGVPEAPIDGIAYSRKNAAWSPSPTGSSSTGSNYALPTGSSVILGGYRVGVGLSVYPDGTLNVTGSSATGSNYALPTGSSSILGGFRVGTGVYVNPDGTINSSGTNYVLPTASPSVLGGVKVGARLTMTGDTLSADIQTGSGSSYSLPTGSSVILGGYRVGSGLSVYPDGTLNTTWGSGSNAQTYDQVVASLSGVVHRWKFNEASGNFADSVGGLTLVAGTGMTYRVAGQIDYGVGFSTGYGVSSGLGSIPVGDSARTFAIAYKPDPTRTDKQTLINYGTDNVDGAWWTVFINQSNTNVTSLALWGGSYDFNIVATPCNYSGWHLFIFSYDANENLIISLDGMIYSQRNASPLGTGSGGNLQVGQDAYDVMQFYGTLDDVAVINRSLDISEMQKLWIAFCKA